MEEARVLESHKLQESEAIEEAKALEVIEAGGARIKWYSNKIGASPVLIKFLLST